MHFKRSLSAFMTAGVLLANAWILVACDRFYVISEPIEYTASMYDQQCIADAIKATPLVRLDWQNVEESTDVCVAGDCTKRVLNSRYQILNTKLDAYAYVQIYESISGKKNIKNYIMSINRDFLEADKPVLQEAVLAVSKAIKRHCTEDGRSAPSGFQAEIGIDFCITTASSELLISPYSAIFAEPAARL